MENNFLACTSAFGLSVDQASNFHGPLLGSTTFIQLQFNAVIALSACTHMKYTSNTRELISH